MKALRRGLLAGALLLLPGVAHASYPADYGYLHPEIMEKGDWLTSACVKFLTIDPARKKDLADWRGRMEHTEVWQQAVWYQGFNPNVAMHQCAANAFLNRYGHLDMSNVEQMVREGDSFPFLVSKEYAHASAPAQDTVAKEVPVEVRVPVNDPRIAVLVTEVAGIREEIGTLSVRFADVEHQFTDTVATLTASVDGLQQQVEILEESIPSMVEDLKKSAATIREAVREEIKPLYDRMDAQEQRYAALEQWAPYALLVLLLLAAAWFASQIFWYLSSRSVRKDNEWLRQQVVTRDAVITSAESSASTLVSEKEAAERKSGSLLLQRDVAHERISELESEIARLKGELPPDAPSTPVDPAECIVAPQRLEISKLPGVTVNGATQPKKLWWYLTRGRDGKLLSMWLVPEKLPEEGAWVPEDKLLRILRDNQSWCRDRNITLASL